MAQASPYELIARLVKAAFAGYSLIDILDEGNLLAYGPGFIVETACDLVADTLSAGLGAVFAFIGCGLLGQLVEKAVDGWLEE